MLAQRWGKSYSSETRKNPRDLTNKRAKGMRSKFNNQQQFLINFQRVLSNELKDLFKTIIFC